jgi:hypothetical protein
MKSSELAVDGGFEVDAGVLALAAVAVVDAYLLSQDLKELHEQISDFLDFYEWRRLRLRATLAARLGVAT